ncbi:MAG: FkbM family methyltransferase [Byssovorax sp.]
MATSLREITHQAFTGFLRHAPFDRGKVRMMSALWKPLSFGQHEREARLTTGQIRMTCDISGHVQRSLYFLGGFEQENCAQWLTFVARAQVIFDVGANVGLYSLLAAVMNPRASVHAFEPTPDLHAKIVGNAGLNGVAERITANQVAIGRKSGAAFINQERGRSGDNDGMNFVTVEPGATWSRRITLCSLDDYCAERGIKRIDLMKMDVEGYEAEALLGARRLLEKKAIRVLLLELLGWSAERAGHTEAEVLEILWGAGYHLYEMQSGRLTKFVRGTKRRRDDLFAFAEPL